MDSVSFYNDILILIFANEKNYAYFRKYYNSNKHYQIMLRDYLKIKHRTKTPKTK